MNKFMFNVWVKAQMAKQSAKDKAKAMKSALLEENGGTESIIIAIVLIIIVVALGIVFREQIWGWVRSLFNAAGNDISDIANTDLTASK